MRRQMSALLLGCLWAASVQAAVQFDMLATRVAPGTPLSALSATLAFSINGTPVGTFPATSVSGPDGSPLRYHFVYNYDAWFECPSGPCNGLTYSTLTVTVCGNSATRVYNNLIYSSGINFPINLPSTFGPGSQPFPNCTTDCPPTCIVTPTYLELVPTQANPNPSATFVICNTDVGQCPPINGTILENCPLFEVTPNSYTLASGECATVTVTYQGNGQGPDICDIVTACGTITAFIEVPLEGQDQPAAFSLGQACPNPFNPTTTINYSLAETEPATLVIFNAAGQQVKTLVDGMAEKGNHVVVFDGSALPSGIYIYQLMAGHDTSQHKMLLVK